ncbi:hypothetical protein MMC17_000675 [Xylographa soralifera]|nr:hypothetical protein [Xylographa soralifera]
MLFYQDPTGALSLSSNGLGKWQTKLVPAKAALGTPLFALLSGSELYLFYVKDDNEVYYQSMDFQTGDWHGGVLANSKLEQPITGLMVTHNQDSKAMEAYFLAGGSLVRVSNGERKTLGSLKGDTFTAAESAQAGDVIYHFNFRGNNNSFNFRGNRNSNRNNYGNINRGRIGGNYGNVGSNSSGGYSGAYVSWWWLL